MKQKVLMYVLGLALAVGPAAGQNVQTAALRVWMDDLSITADGQTAARLTVYENDPERNYEAFNLSLLVPDGITVAKVKKGRDWVDGIELSERATATHSISCNMPDATTIKIICSSTQNDELYPDDEDGNLLDELFTIDLIANPAMMNGSYTIATEGIVFGRQQGSVVTGYVPDPLPSFQLTVTGGQDGLSIPYTLTSASVGTLVLPFDAEVPTGLQVYAATDVSASGVVQLSRQEGIVAGRPLIVAGEAGTYTFTGVPTTAGTEFTEGVLTGVTEAKVISEGYVLQTLGGETGFYRVDAARPVTVPSYRCWLTYDGAAEVLAFRFDTDGIDGMVNGKNVNAKWYGLDGRITTQPRKGVYIHNGQKRLKIEE